MQEERKVGIYNIMIIRNPEPDDNKGQKGTRAGKVVSESTLRVSIHRIGASHTFIGSTADLQLEHVYGTQPLSI